ncbi:MAG: hypothetical protein AAFV07_00715 [Bacteroidota bacterium]
MKKILVFALVCIMAIACSPVEEGQEMLQAEPQAQQAPSLDLTKTYYAHFKVELENGTRVVLNSIELDDSYWHQDEKGNPIPDVSRIKEELGYEDLETLRGEPVKQASIAIRATEQLEEGANRNGVFCTNNVVPSCTCLTDIYNAIFFPDFYNFAIESGEGWIVLCTTDPVYQIINAFVWVPLAQAI